MSQLTTTMLAEWIRPLITSGAKVFPGRLPDMPNRAVGIVKSSGPGLAMDGLFDVKGFIVTCRGAENNLDDAEMIANEIDDIIIGNSNTIVENFLIGDVGSDVYISQIGRTGSGPTQLPMSDSLSRWVFNCTYFAYVSTNVGQVFNG